MSKKIYGLGLLYVITTYTAQFFTIAFNFVLMSRLTTYNFGVYSFSKTLSQYMDFSNLGTRYAMDRYVPICAEQKAKLILHNTIFVTFLISLVTLVIYFSFGLIDNLSVFLFVLAGVFFALTNVYCVYKRDRSDFLYMIIINFVSISIPILFSSVAVFYSGNINYISVLFCVGQLVVFLFILKTQRITKLMYVRPRLFLTSFRFLLKTGFPLFLASLVTMLGMTVDRLLVKFFCGYNILGTYSIILYIFSFMLVLPNVLGQVFLPNIIKSVTNNDFSYIMKSIIFVLLILFPLFIIVFLCVPFVIESFVPKYSIYSYDMCLASLVVLPYSLMFPFIAALNALDKRKIILVINIFSFLLYFVILIIYLQIYHSNINFQILLAVKFVYGLIILLLLFNVFLFSIKSKKNELSCIN